MHLTAWILGLGIIIIINVVGDVGGEMEQFLRVGDFSGSIPSEQHFTNSKFKILAEFLGSDSQ